MRLLGAILAGGRATRFGSDKALAMLDGRPLIAHVAEALAEQADAVVVCGREWGALPSLSDRPAPDLGPLGGLCAALHFAADEGYDAVLSAGCDTLPVPKDLLAILFPSPLMGEARDLAFRACLGTPSRSGGGDPFPDAALTDRSPPPLRHRRPALRAPRQVSLLPHQGGGSLHAAYLRDQPTIGLWPASLAPLLDQHLTTTTDLSLRAWARLCGAIGVECDATLTNLNTPADLARYASEAGDKESAHGLP